MKLATYSLIFVLVFLSIFTVGYLASNNYIGFGAGTGRSATISRFTEPTEVKSLYDLLDKLPVIGAGPVVLDKNGQSLLYYNESTGYLHRINLTTSTSKDESLERLRPYLANLQWSLDRQKILASDGTENILYNLASGESRILPKSIQFSVFSPSGDRVSYIDYDAEQNTANLVVADSNFTSLKALTLLTVGSWSLNWVNQTTLALGYNNQNTWGLMLVDANNGGLTRVFVNLPNLQTTWSPNGQSLLYSFSDKNHSPMLAYQNMANIGNDIKLPLVTPASNCVWSIDNVTIYCAVSKSTTRGQEDDEFVSLQIGHTLQNLRMNNFSKIKAENLLLSADEKYLFFRNTSDGNLYRLRIVPE